MMEADIRVSMYYKRHSWRKTRSSLGLLVVLLAVPLVSKELWVHALGRRVLLLLLLLDTVVEEGREDATQGERQKGQRAERVTKLCALLSWVHSPVPMVLVGLVVRRMVLGLRHLRARKKNRKRSRKTDHSSATGPRNVEA